MYIQNFILILPTETIKIKVMSKKVYLSKENLERMVEQLNEFSAICGIKNVSILVNGETKRPYSDSHSVMFTETKLQIDFKDVDNSNTMFKYRNERSIVVYFNKVMLDTLMQFDTLVPLVKYADRYESETLMCLKIYSFHSITQQGEKRFGLGIGEHSWTKQGIELYCPDIAKEQMFSTQENQNTYEFTNSIADIIFSTLLRFVDQPFEHWNTIKEGNNNFKPNIVNDLKYGGRY